MYFGFTVNEDRKLSNHSNLKCKLYSKDVSAKLDETSNLLKHLHHQNEVSEISYAQAV